jgi:hypothetical protein
LLFKLLIYLNHINFFFKKDIVGIINGGEVGEIRYDFHGCFDSCDLMSQLDPSLKITCCQKDNCNKMIPSTSTPKLTTNPKKSTPRTTTTTTKKNQNELM